MKALKIILIILAVIAVGIVMTLGYFGIIPGLNKVFGSDKPRDLGIKYSDADYKEIQAKTGTKQEEMAANLAASNPTGIAYEGKTSFNTEISQEELTAAVNNQKWQYFAISNVQIRINRDGTAEMSGILNVDKLLGWANAFGVPQSLTEKGISYFKMFGNPPFYVKAGGKVKNNKFDINLQKAEIGRLPIPVSYFSTYKGQIDSFANDRMPYSPNVYIRSAEFSSGKLKIDADYPAKTLYKK